MAHKIIWSPGAADDLQGISTYLSRDSETMAARVIQRILDSLEKLEDHPYSGPQIREWKRTSYRHMMVPPHRVIYRVEKEAVFIIAIVHGAQDLKKFMRKKRRR